LDLDLPPNTAVERAATREAAYEAVRLDKGSRIRAAVTDLSPEDLIMVVDEDDLVSRRLVAFVQDRRMRSQSPQAWVIDKGYAWQDGSASAQLVDQFHRLCGTCLIVPAGRYKLFRLGPDASDADHHEATLELGSHRRLVDSDLRAGRRFGRVPFRAAIYRTGHANSTQSLLGI
jgi:hypothetical protein